MTPAAQLPLFDEDDVVAPGVRPRTPGGYPPPDGLTPVELAAMLRRHQAAMQVVRADRHLDDGERLDLLWFVVAPSPEVQLAEASEAERQKQMRDERRGRRAAA